MANSNSAEKNLMDNIIIQVLAEKIEELNVKLGQAWDIIEERNDELYRLKEIIAKHNYVDLNEEKLQKLATEEWLKLRQDECENRTICGWWKYGFIEGYKKAMEE